MASDRPQPEERPVWQRRTEKVSEIIAREIVHDIVGQNLSPGAMLAPEVEMVEKYDVGRASLREALRSLEGHGLIAIKPGRGGGPVYSGVRARDFATMSTLYFHLGRATYRELMEARMSIEPMMAGVLARDPDAVRDQLGDVMSLTRDAVADADDPAWLEASSGFHTLILSLSGNPILDMFGGSLRYIFARRVSHSLFAAEYRSVIADQHAGIAEAVLAGDPEKAERLMREHMLAYSQQLEQRYPGLLDEIVDWR
jgi:DNA-binding FadR family transcriptional regulator